MSSIEKRISRELEGYLYTIEHNHNLIDVGFQYENSYYIFTLDKNYPFRPPLKFSKNYVNINYTSNHVPSGLLDMYKEKFSRCPCCETILCPALWSPGIHLIRIIEEYKKFKEDVISLQKCRFIDKINYIPDDIKYYIKSFL